MRCATLLVLVSVACTEVPDPPTLTHIEPNRVAEGTLRQAVIHGGGFLADVRGNLSDPENAEVNAAFGASVAIADTATAVGLDDVRLASTAQLTAVLPALTAGTYNLTVTDPRDHRVELVNALEVIAAECTVDNDCVALYPCVGSATCVVGVCETAGIADADGDGHAPPSCGGDDCDDDCNVCWTGHVEDCDGFDNDCDPGTADGADETGLGDSCDGTDTDLCAEGVLECTGTLPLSCTDTSGDNLDLCDGTTDDDCNPATADGADEAGFGDACDGGDADLCPEGVLGCTGSLPLTCDDATADNAELCNGTDDDCDPSTLDGADEPTLGDLCDGPDADSCLEGVLECTGSLPLACTDTTGDPTNWWDGAYSTRIPLTIDETVGGSLAGGYSVVVTMDTETRVTAGDLLGTGDDLRVVWEGGGAPVELDRRLINPDTVDTQIWFKTQSAITTSDASYFLYFGNSSATSPPAHWADSMGAAATPSGVYLAADDFEEESTGVMPGGWEGSSNYGVEDVAGNKVLGVTGANGPADYLFAGDLSWIDVAVSTRMKIQLTSGDYYGLYLRADGTTNFNTLWFGLANQSSLQAYNLPLASASATGLSPGAAMLESWGVANAGTSWHTLEVHAIGRDVAYYYDRTLMGTGTLAPNEMDVGRIGTCAGYNATRAFWDDFVVRKIVDPEPVVTTGVEETNCP